MGSPAGLFLCREREVKRCPTNQSVHALTPVAVGLLNMSNTAPSIKRQWTNITTSMNETLPPTKDTAVHGSVSVTVTSSSTHSVRSARSKECLLLLKRYITSYRSLKVEATRKATSWLYVNPVTQELLLRAVTGGGGQISKTFLNGQRRGASC